MRQARSFPAVILWCSTLALAATPAHADWQYTKWGMSPAQVIAASKGNVSEGRGDVPHGSTLGSTDAHGSYTSGQYHFQTFFIFNGGGLVAVRLIADSKDQSLGLALKSDLEGLYGKPFDIQYFRSVLGNSAMETWRDAKTNNTIVLFTGGEDGNEIQYRVLTTQSGKGL